VKLFESIKPLFKGKPLLVVLNKTDLRKMEDLTEEEKTLIESMKDGLDEVVILPSSSATKEGIDAVRNKACEMLLQKRIETKIKQGKTDHISNRIFMTKVQQRADRPSHIPATVHAVRNGEELPYPRELEKDVENKNGGAGVHLYDIRKTFILEKEAWRYDQVPEIMDGRNVADFVDPDIDAKLAELEREEELLFQASIPTKEEVEEEDHNKQLQKTLDKIHLKKKSKRLEQVLKINSSQRPVTRSKLRHDAEDVMEKLIDRGTSLPVIEEVMKKRGRSASKARRMSRRAERDTDGMDVDEGRSRSRSRSRADHRSVTPSRLERSLSKPADRAKAKLEQVRKTKRLTKHARKGEADRHIPDLKPKHLYSGKRGRGSTDWR
jgi:nucleolar GTP-binding protein